MDLVSDVARTIATHRLLTPGERVLVALSGGADSVALLLVLARLGYEVRAAHCNFCLRGEESQRDEAFVRRLCHRLAMPLSVTRFDTQCEAAATGESIEMAARRLRYAWFGELLAREGMTHVAVAHHADDNAETLLLNLVRGTGLQGLTGMAYEREGVVRPMLDVRRADVVRFLEAEGQDYVTDSTNADTHYRRNMVRHELLPLLARMNPSIVRTLCRTMSHLRAEQAVHDMGMAQVGRQVCTAREHDRIVHLGRLRELPAPVAEVWLHELMGGYGFTARQISTMQEARVGAMFEAAAHVAVVGRGQIEVGPRPEVLSTPQPLEVAGLTCRHEAWDGKNVVARGRTAATLDADALRGPLRVRSLLAGDRFAPYGMRGTRLVSDYLTDRHRSRLEKLRTLAVCDDAGIVWLVGETVAQRVAVGQNTRRVVQIERKEDSVTKETDI